MNSIDENLKLKILRGKPILLEKTNCFFIHRTIGEIIDYTQINFLKAVQLFSMSEKDIQELAPIPGMNTFMFLLLSYNNGSFISNQISDGLNFFIGAENLVADMENKKFLFSYQGIDNIELNEEGFNEIVNYIDIIYNGNFTEEQKNLSEAELKMKNKFDKLRKQREAAKKHGNEDSISFSDMLGGFTVRNYNFDWEKVMNLPYYTFFFLLKKLRVYDDYDTQLKAAFAGADMKDKKLHHWLSGDFDED